MQGRWSTSMGTISSSCNMNHEASRKNVLSWFGTQKICSFCFIWPSFSSFLRSVGRSVDDDDGETDTDWVEEDWLWTLDDDDSNHPTKEWTCTANQCKRREISIYRSIRMPLYDACMYIYKFIYNAINNVIKHILLQNTTLAGLPSTIHIVLPRPRVCYVIVNGRCQKKRPTKT